MVAPEDPGVAGKPVVGEVMVRGGVEQGARARGTRTEPDLPGEAGTPSQDADAQA